MKKVVIRGADGSTALLAFVRQIGKTVYVCPITRYREVSAGDETSAVGFPAVDVTDVPEDGSVAA